MCCATPQAWGEPATHLSSPHIQMWRWQHSKDAVSPEHLQSLLLPQLTALPPGGEPQGPPGSVHPAMPTALLSLLPEGRGTFWRHILCWTTKGSGVNPKIRAASRKHGCQRPSGGTKYRCQILLQVPAWRSRVQPSSSTGAVGGLQGFCSQMSLWQERTGCRTARTGASPPFQCPGGSPLPRTGPIPTPGLAQGTRCSDPSRWQQGLRVSVNGAFLFS